MAQVFDNAVSLNKIGIPTIFSETRRSTMIEVHPNVSEAPHLRSSIPLPKIDFSKTQNASRRIIPYGPSLQNVFFFEITTWDQGTVSFRNKIAEMCYLYRRTGSHTRYHGGSFKPRSSAARISSPPTSAIGCCFLAPHIMTVFSVPQLGNCWLP